MQADYSPLVDSVQSGFRELLLPLIIFVGVVSIAFAYLEGRLRRSRRSRWRSKQSQWQRSAAPWTPKHDALPRVPDAADQLRTVMLADFKAQPLLNKSEARLFRAMDKLVIELAPPGWQVMAQVSLGEILRCEDKDAYACINSKRVDLLIVDENCKPLHAIEYQGGAHFKGAYATAARDAVKKEALRRVVERLVQKPT